MQFSDFFVIIYIYSKGGTQMVNIGNDWDNILDGEFDKEYYKKLRAFLKAEYSTHNIHPDMYDIFNALKWTSYADTKVVILGQEIGRAHV